MEKDFVTFYSPGTFVSEETTKEISAWDVEEAKEMAKAITERYNATPYGFRFITRSRGETDLDSSVVNRSPMHWLGGTVRTLEEVEEANLPDENILRSNMRCNNVNKVITNTNSWKFTSYLGDDDIVLEWPQ